MLAAAVPDGRGMSSRDYYHGKVSAPTDAQRAYVDARDRADEAQADPTAYGKGTTREGAGL